MKLPPHNQRRLNAKIKELYGDRYRDWYDMANEIRQRGGTYVDIASRFTALGVSVSIFTIHKWLKAKERQTGA